MPDRCVPLSIGGNIAVAPSPPQEEQNQTKGLPMRLVIAFFFPWLTFFTIGRPFAGVICLLLQITVLGWIPATIWAVYALSQYKTDQKIHRALSRQY
jgi:uncharacterized membrane protein YqaE (UPF0057 family)